jgi:hypothetical protein
MAKALMRDGQHRQEAQERPKAEFLAAKKEAWRLLSGYPTPRSFS